VGIGSLVPRPRSSTPVSAALAEHVARGGLVADPPQAAAARVLDRIATELAKPAPLLSRRAPVKGAYLVGPVGRGKTMLMDLFFNAVPIEAKRRAHFDEFMDELHTAIAEFRKTERGKDADPIAAVTKPIAEVRLLCLDEFQVTDITNAMLLGRLFEQLFAGGVTLVATSNTEPDDLYRDGLNRQLFLPFIELLKSRVEIVRLAGATDHRLAKFAGEAVFQFGTGPEIDSAMDRLWTRLTGGGLTPPETLRSLGREIVVPAAAMGAARFPFAALCEAPLGARDYLRLAHRYDTLMIDNIPVFGRTNPSATKRFVLLIDALYDRGIKLAASFTAPLDRLAAETRNQQEFSRTLSRLSEMQSAQYLSAARHLA
jgi:cell division protein ZapE